MSVNNVNQQSSGGIGLAGVLGVAFVILKLCGVIEWSWLWVLAPFWIPFALFLVIVGVIFGVAAIIGVIAKVGS